MTPPPSDPPPPGGPAAGPTLVPPPADGPIPLPPEPHPSSVYSFLEPAQGPNEIGRLGQYRVTRLLGAGGMGYVFEAEDDHLRRTVALKVMKPDIARDRGFRERFLGEARAAARLVSENVVTVYQVGCVADVPFLAMQLLHGEALQDRLRKMGPLTPHQALVVAREAASGLHAAHRVGFVHRDVKPANLWLETDPGGRTFRRLRVLDFGLARAYGEETHLTASGIIVGTPHYMSPEQASGQALDGRADLFSLGCVLYTSLTGEMAFDGPTAMAVLMALATHTPPPLQERNPKVPAALAGLIGRMMSKNRDRRPASAEAVLAELDALRFSVPADPFPFQVLRPDAGGSSALTDELRSLPSLYPTGPYAAPPAAVAAALETPAAPSSTSLLAPPAPPRGPSAPTLGSIGDLDLTPPKRSRRGALIAAGAAGFALAAGAVAFLSGRGGDSAVPTAAPTAGSAGPPVPLGVLFARSGPRAGADRPMLEGATLAAEQVNAAGGVLGRPIQLLEADDQSTPGGAAREAERLLGEAGAVALVGGGDSARRRAIRPLVERRAGVLFAPAASEGLARSPRVVYFGGAPNQRLAPLLARIAQGPAKRVFLAGDESVASRVLHELARAEAKRTKGFEVAGEGFLAAGAAGPAEVLRALTASGADALLLTASGAAQAALLAGLPAGGMPVFSATLREAELPALAKAAGVTVCAPYFQAFDAAGVRDFEAALRKRFGPDRGYTEEGAAAYLAVKLWAKGASAGSLESGAVLEALRGATFPGLDGELKLDPESQYVWFPGRTARVNGRGEAIPTPGEPRELVRPEPYPPGRSAAEWDQFRMSLGEK